MQYKSSLSVNMVDSLVEVIGKPEFLEVRHSIFNSHISLFNMAEFDNSSSIEANNSEIEKFGEIITANTEEKITSSFKKYEKQSMSSKL